MEIETIEELFGFLNVDIKKIAGEPVSVMYQGRATDEEIVKSLCHLKKIKIENKIDKAIGLKQAKYIIGLAELIKLAEEKREKEAGWMLEFPLGNYSITKEEWAKKYHTPLIDSIHELLQKKGNIRSLYDKTTNKMVIEVYYIPKVMKKAKNQE